MDLVGTGDWEDFKNLISVDSSDTFGKQTIIWRRLKSSVDRYKEDNSQGTYHDVTLRCLVNYNYMRSWPITNFTEAGELQAQSIQVIFYKKYLKDNGYLTADGKLDYKPDHDRFVLDGIIRKPVGDSSISQAGDESLLYEVIMEELKTPTGEGRT